MVFVAIFVEMLDELLVLVGQDESKWRKVEHLAIELLHLLDDPSEVVLGTNHTSLRNVD